MKDGQTIGQWLNWDFKTNGSLEVLDKNSNLIYFENAGGWDRHEYNSEEKLMYYENSDGFIKDNRTPEIIEHNGRKYQLIHPTMKDGQTIGQWLNWDFKANGNLDIRDRNGNCIYFEDSDGYWSKIKYNSQGNIIYSENSNGKIVDNRGLYQRL